MIKRMVMVCVIALGVVTTPVLASDLGVRSIRVVVSNMTMADFTVAAIQKQNGQWIQGMEPAQGSLLHTYQATTFGIFTNNYNDSVSGQVVLTGYGTPLQISFSNNVQGQVQYSVSGDNIDVRVDAHLVNTGMRNHGIISMTITPAHGVRPAS